MNQSYETYIFESMQDKATNHVQRAVYSRIANRLAERGIETIEELKGKTKYELLKFYGIGKDSITTLSEVLEIDLEEGEPRYVTLARKREKRNEQIRLDYENGMRKCDIARKHGISGSQVANVLKSDEERHTRSEQWKEINAICRLVGYQSPTLVQNVILRHDLQNRQGLTYQDVLTINMVGEKTAKVICKYLGIEYL